MVNNLDNNLQVQDLEISISNMRGEVTTTRTAIHKINERNTELGRQIVRHDEKIFTKDCQHLREIKELKCDHRKKMDDFRKTMEKEFEKGNRRRVDDERIIQGLKDQIESLTNQNDDLLYKCAHQQDYIHF